MSEREGSLGPRSAERGPSRSSVLVRIGFLSYTLPVVILDLAPIARDKSKTIPSGHRPGSRPSHGRDMSFS
jgi:hypothetical protein